MSKRGNHIRVGVVGARRGLSLAQNTGPELGMELVAVCDAVAGEAERISGELDVVGYTDYEEFLEHDMDAVILANFFHEHAPFAIRALQAGKHVMSETTACFTLGEGVALIEAVERAGKIYMLAENYPYMVFNQEMRRLYQSGEIGEFKYGEGEYVHPMSAEDSNRIAPGVNHWRNWIPATYYVTHCLAPIMYITDKWPVEVSGFVIPYDPEDEECYGKTAKRNDLACVIIVKMDNGALVKLLRGSLRGGSVWVRIHGRKGLMENLRWGKRDMLRVSKEPFDKEPDEPVERVYLPAFPEHHGEALRSGHGGGDFFVTYRFAEAIRNQKQPYLGVHRAVAMSVVGILAYRSALAASTRLEVPDFREAAVRREYADDDWSPDPAKRRPDQPWPSVLGDIRPGAEGCTF
jgi:predicted dehydrogenase